MQTVQRYRREISRPSPPMEAEGDDTGLRGGSHHGRTGGHRQKKGVGSRERERLALAAAFSGQPPDPLRLDPPAQSRLMPRYIRRWRRVLAQTRRIAMKRSACGLLRGRGLLAISSQPLMPRNETIGAASSRCAPANWSVVISGAIINCACAAADRPTVRRGSSSAWTSIRVGDLGNADRSLGRRRRRGGFDPVRVAAAPGDKALMQGRFERCACRVSRGRRYRRRSRRVRRVRARPFSPRSP